MTLKGKFGFFFFSIISVTLPFLMCTPLVYNFNQKVNYKDKAEIYNRVKNGWDTNINYFNDNQKNCGYEACDAGKPDMLNVHLVPHTHDDVGWLKTVDQYYYGARSDIQDAGVQYILDTVIQALKDDRKRRFIYVEIAFFKRWWDEQNLETQSFVKQLVNEGRLEFILGGWCMNDEATTHYNAIIDQHTLGFKFLNDTFGECAIPKIGWQIDPFGHSREQASLFAQFGFDGLFFGRLDYQDKDKRMKDKTGEMLWMASDNLGDQASLFTGVNYNGYGPPDGFCFDQGCRDTPIMDNPSLEDYNVDAEVNAFINACKQQSLNYTTNHIMMTMGSDFQFQNAHKNFKNLDKLIKYVNKKQDSGSKINLLYSTPSCYLYALNKANQSYTTKTDDFFPYASRENTFWTGYFSSRPALKRYVRESNNLLQVCKQIEAFSAQNTNPVYRAKVEAFKRAMGVAQHHDAVSGTEKQHVAYDYAKRLANGTAGCQDLMNYFYHNVLSKNTGALPPRQQYCGWSNISVCDVTADTPAFTVTLYNPLARPVTYWMNIPVQNPFYQVYDANQKTVHALSLINNLFTRNLKPKVKMNVTDASLVFKAEIPPLGYTTYYVKNLTTNDLHTTVENMPRMKRYNLRDDPPPEDFYIENEHIKLIYSKVDGLLKTVINKDKNITTMVRHEIMYYKSFKGNNSEGRFQASGAYIFRPNGSEPVSIGDYVDVLWVWTQLYMEIQTTYGDWAVAVHRLYFGEKYVEIDWTVGPIPIDDGIGKEVISRFTTDLKTDNTFYTDSNGREELKRVINYRPTWKLNQTEPVAGNYYPVNSRILLRDEKQKVQMSVVTDRSQGGGCVKDGQMELMLHRRMLVDDAFGVGEPLNETGINGEGLIVTGTQRLFLEDIESSARLYRDSEERMYMAPSISYAQVNYSSAEYAKNFRTQLSFLTKKLPENVHLLTLETLDDSTDAYLVRLEHYYEKGMDAEFSKPVNVSLDSLIMGLKIAAVEEMTLGANRKLEDAKRLTWNVQGYGQTTAEMKSFVRPVTGGDFTIELQPMQIRTFRVHISTGEKWKVDA